MKKRESHNLNTLKKSPSDELEVIGQEKLIHRLLFNCDIKHNTIKQYRHLWKLKKLSPNIQEMILKESGYEMVESSKWKLKSE